MSAHATWSRDLRGRRCRHLVWHRMRLIRIRSLRLNAWLIAVRGSHWRLHLWRGITVAGIRHWKITGMGHHAITGGRLPLPGWGPLPASCAGALAHAWRTHRLSHLGGAHLRLLYSPRAHLAMSHLGGKGGRCRRQRLSNGSIRFGCRLSWWSIGMLLIAWPLSPRAWLCALRHIAGMCITRSRLCLRHRHWLLSFDLSIDVALCLAPVARVFLGFFPEWIEELGMPRCGKHRQAQCRHKKCWYWPYHFQFRHNVHRIL